MYIKELILDGFKSYANRTIISGFDRSFNAITGFNGTGKSNVLDAICFVLGLTSLKNIRVGSLQELVYKQGQAGVTKASVSIVFDNNDAQQSPVGYENCENIVVTRQITLAGKSKYFINGHTAQQNHVISLFQSVGLNINNPHFLIMQGRITQVLNMKSDQVLSMVESAAGTNVFEDKKQNAIKTIKKKDTKIQEVERILKEEIEPSLDKFSAKLELIQKYEDLKNRNQELSSIVLSYRYHNVNNDLNRHKEDQTNYERMLVELEEEMSETESYLKEIDETIAEFSSNEQNQDFNEAKELLEKCKIDFNKKKVALEHKEKHLKKLLRDNTQYNEQMVDINSLVDKLAEKTSVAEENLKQSKRKK
eukprot:TRINITY_DN3228_c2_g1_i3.p1 TRINITY_DN3228_c2_g1~~TRINITY_DN3228_c2_g1_i3.p1  ORF type:complete len:364 (+),score=112.81 TRINITY_DN3228_c2_g1_i3:44-1135(+)